MIGIIAAMDMEVEAIIKYMSYEHQDIHGISFYKGILNERNVVVMKSDVGKGNAVMAATIMMEHFNIDQMINIGTAGGLKQDQQILDVVISKTVVQHDVDTSALDGETGIGLLFHANEAMIQACLNVFSEIDSHVHCGQVASGDQFIASDIQLKKLEQQFPHAICAEMEAGGIAQVCEHYHVPFVVVRSLSDVACHPESHMDFLEYAKQASERSANACYKLMRVL